jgi:hypothetical protein
VPAVGVMRKSADDASCKLFASGMKAAACILHTVAKIVSCSCLERVGTEYHTPIAVFAVGSICAVQQYRVRVRLVSEFLMARLYEI